MANFLVLGAGLVAGPVVEYLARGTDDKITLASHIISEAKMHANPFANVTPIETDVNDSEALTAEIRGQDVVISLVPPEYHTQIAQVCVAEKVHFISASYETPYMRALSSAAKAADICLLNEIGLDPGIDHLSAMDIIDKAHDKGGTVEAFVSWCGGLPAPAHNDNLLGYKFSWQPKGAIMVLLNEAAYLRGGNRVVIAGEDLMNWAAPVTISGISLECYPNRNSVPYGQIYGIDSANTLLRGTLRYPEFCQILQAAKTLGLMDLTPRSSPSMPWSDYICNLNGGRTLAKICAPLPAPARRALDWLGCFSSRETDAANSSLDVFCALLLDKLSYKDGEQDMIILQHKFVMRQPSGHKYYIKSTLKDIGRPGGHSAMARTVGYPVAMAASMLASGAIKKRGAALPVTAEFYQPILAALKAEGISFDEQVLDSAAMSETEFLSELNQTP